MSDTNELRAVKLTDVEIISRLQFERDQFLAEIGGCTDGYCIIIRPLGMHTNGGCKCAGSLTKMQRFAYAHNRFSDRLRALLSTSDARAPSVEEGRHG